MTDEEKRAFVTNDKGLHQPKILSQTDVEIMKEVQSGGGVPIKSLDDLKELARAAGERFDEFKGLCSSMTEDQAKVVRQLRVDEGFSWRAVAQACYNLGWGK